MTDYLPMRLQLSTPRLTMRPWQHSDADDYRALVTERGDGEPTMHDVLTRMDTQLAGTAETGLALLATFRRDNGAFIGYCGLIVGRSTVAEPEIAYELARAEHGFGYATEAARAVLDAAVATGRERLWSTVRTWNAPSLRVLDKLGFTRDHVTSDDKGEVVWLTRSLVPPGRP